MLDRLTPQGAPSQTLSVRGLPPSFGLVWFLWARCRMPRTVSAAQGRPVRLARPSAFSRSAIAWKLSRSPPFGLRRSCTMRAIPASSRTACNPHSAPSRGLSLASGSGAASAVSILQDVKPPSDCEPQHHASRHHSREYGGGGVLRQRRHQRIRPLQKVSR